MLLDLDMPRDRKRIAPDGTSDSDEVNAIGKRQQAPRGEQSGWISRERTSDKGMPNQPPRSGSVPQDCSFNSDGFGQSGEDPSPPSDKWQT
jgi:hypothetical protein